MKSLSSRNKTLNRLKSKLIFLILSISLVFVLTSCSSSGGTYEKSNFRYGSQALELELLNPGVEDFYEGEELTVLVEYFNRGTADIVDGEFFVSGYDLKYMQISLDPKFISITGKDEYDPDGRQSQIMTIRSNPIKMPENIEEFMQTVKLTACYDYQTLATAPVCIDPDPKGHNIQDKICTMHSVSPGSQGAPIVINNVEPIVSKNDLRLNIQFSNQGDGIVYDRTISNQKCFADLDKYSDVGKVDVLNVEYSGNKLNCQPSNPIRLIDGVGKLTCECKGCVHDYIDAYETLVTMELAYGYRNEVVKKVRILSE